MSQWTHVNGSIRFDSLMGRGMPTKKELGRICKWEDENTDHWDTTIVPCGSEGSIEYFINITGNENSIARHVVVFAGDLRDYDDVDEIVYYFETITKDKMIRSGIIKIDVEYSNSIILRYDEEKCEWIKTIL